MAFLETPEFPALLARGITGGPEFATEVVEIASGYEQRNATWSQARQRWDAASAIRTLTEWVAISDHFYAVSGRLHGFRLKDPADYSVTSATGLLQPLHTLSHVGTVGYGYGVPSYQLVKRYTRGSMTHDRVIRKPVSGATFRRATASATPSLATTTGVATFSADQSKSISSHTVGASHVLHLSSAFSPVVTVGQRVYITGVSGSAAALLNSLSHEVTNVSTVDVTVSTVTTGLSATGGTAYLYPQSTEALDWTGEFRVPVRFDTDRLERQLITRLQGGDYAVQATSIPLIEIRT